MIDNCFTTVGLFAALMDSALTPNEKRLLDIHLARCPRCVELLESYRATARIVRTATDVDLPSDVAERLMKILGR